MPKPVWSIIGKIVTVFADGPNGLEPVASGEVINEDERWLCLDNHGKMVWVLVENVVVVREQHSAN